jgi:hypothetical protein
MSSRHIIDLLWDKFTVAEQKLIKAGLYTVIKTDKNSYKVAF